MEEKDQKQIDIKVELDTTGLFCPEPLFQVKNLSDKIEIGNSYKVLADDPAAEEDLTRWAKRTGTKIIKFSKEGDLLIFIFKKLK